MNQLSLDEPSSTATSGSTVLKLTVAYDGTDFRGFAAAAGMNGPWRVSSPRRSRARAARRVDLVCAGRTDAGVHAWGQVVSCAAATTPTRVRLIRSVNRQLGPEIVVRAAELVDASFDARRSARWRAYRYTIVNRPVPDPFLARTAWWVPEPLDLSLLRLGADPFLGDHDFATFCRKGPAGPPRCAACSSRRGVTSATVCCATTSPRPRSVGRWCVPSWARSSTSAPGRSALGDILGHPARARDRGAAGRVGAPHGLCLWEVGY